MSVVECVIIIAVVAIAMLSVLGLLSAVTIFAAGIAAALGQFLELLVDLAETRRSNAESLSRERLWAAEDAQRAKRIAEDERIVRLNRDRTRLAKH